MIYNDLQKNSVKETIKNALREKFKNYKPESKHMPFHFKLLGKDRMALYSFIQSLNTTFGTSIFEPVSVSFARLNSWEAKSHVPAGEQISEESFKVIQEIMSGLETAKTLPNKPEEIEAIRSVCQKGKMLEVKSTLVDLMLVNKHDEIFLFDIKTVKPNVGGFKEFKRTLLEWVAGTFASNPTAQVNTLIAIPYNPYEPQPYSRWTMRGMIDLEKELKVAEEFWDFLGGEGAYQTLLDCFEKAGLELRDEVDKYFERFRNEK